MKTKETAPPFWEMPASRRLEFRERFQKGDQIAKTVVAFANGAGGKIVFGVQNRPRKIVGIPDDGLFILEEPISDHIFSKCVPPIIPEIYIQAAGDKNLLVVEIYPGSNKPYYIKSKGKHKGTYVRIGASNKPASPEMLEELERRRRKISFDSVPVYDLSREDIDLEGFMSDYRNATGRPLTDEHLRNMGLLVSERDIVFPTNAAVLMSDSQVRRRLFPYAKIECARFKGTDARVFLDQTSIDGPVYGTVERVIEFVKKNIALSSEIGEVYREDRWEYPLSAVREAVCNAIIHRDYAILGSDIKVAIFDDMLEITSPGPLPENMPIEKVGSGRSEIRNRVLAPIFKDLRLIEAWGTGIRKMREEIGNASEIDLVLQETGQAFQVQFRKKTGSNGQLRVLADDTGQASDKHRTSTGQVPDKFAFLEFCMEGRTIKEMMAFLNLKHRETFTNNHLRPLINESLIKMTIPGKPNSPKQKYVTTSAGLEEIIDKSKKFSGF